MKIHAIQTGTVAVKEFQMQGKGTGLRRRLNTLFDKNWTEPLPIYAWVIEHPEGIIVVDTGETTKATEPWYFPKWHPYYRLGVKEWVEPQEEIGPKLRALGIQPDEVSKVVLTHLHTDHAGGLHYFPKSEIFVSRTEYRLAQGTAGKIRGFLPNRWPAWFAPQLVDFTSTPVGPFPLTYPLTQAGDIILVATPGHTTGHLSVIVQDGSESLFLAGDTSYSQKLLLAGVVDGVSESDSEAKQTIQRIQQYAREVPTVYLPSHDPESARRLTDRETISFSPAGVALP